MALAASLVVMVQGTAVANDCTQTTSGFTPIIDMGQATFQGWSGGLYGGGANVPPSTLQAAAIASAAQITTRDASGAPSPTGTIGLVSIGFSNVNLEFGQFIHDADADPAFNESQVTLVNGAQAGASADVVKD